MLSLTESSGSHIEENPVMVTGRFQRGPVVVRRTQANEQDVERVRRIHALIAAAIDVTDTNELEPIMTKLRAALKDHIRRIRVMAVAKLLPGE